MNFSANIIEISKENPFANDLLGREQYADVLTSLIDTSKKGFTMSINATWGYGKTTFIRMWEAKLRAQGYSTVYVNAWEIDYIDNPFAAVMATIWSQTMKDSEHIKTPSEVIQTLGDIAS
jgi:predicted KAP-like P-loop ATPase